VLSAGADDGREPRQGPLCHLPVPAAPDGDRRRGGEAAQQVQSVLGLGLQLHQPESSGDIVA